MAGGAGLFIGAGKQGVVKESLAQGDTLVGKRWGSGQLGDGKTPGQPEAVGCADQVSGRRRIRRGRWASLPDFADRKGGRQPVLQQSRDPVALARMGGGIGGDLEGFVAVEETIEVDIDANDGRAGQVEVAGRVWREGFQRVVRRNQICQKDWHRAELAAQGMNRAHNARSTKDGFGPMQREC